MAESHYRYDSLELVSLNVLEPDDFVSSETVSRGLMADFGPFSVDPAQVGALGGANFGQFVARLLATEISAHGMSGTTLETTYLENVGDGGVDAGLRDAAGTAWIPAGDSAWQFKAGDLTPAKCKSELLGATKAIEVLRAGGTYRLVLGATLTSAKLQSRRAKLIEAANELRIVDASAKVDVIAADGLARWIEEFPALAVSPLLRGTGVIGQTLPEWASSIRHTTTWVSSAARDLQLDALRATITVGAQLDIHLDGVSGLGKTRLVLEALRGQPYEPVVVYSPAADAFPVTVLSQLQSQKRTAIVVIDECDRKQHEIYAGVLTTGTSIRLITIGEPGGSSTRTPMISLDGLGDAAMHELLQANRPLLTPEAERVVVQIAAGNIDYALKLSQVAIEQGSGSAGSLISEPDLLAFFAERLPNGQLFLASCALALFSRFGFDGETAHELEGIAAGLNLSSALLRSAAAELQQSGLLTKQGRYRAVGPHPVAVFLAARGWEEFGNQIVSGLFNSIDEEMIERLFRRAADVGEFDAASPAISAVLGPDGPFMSLETIAKDKNSSLLIHFAVLAPDALLDRLASLIAGASEEDLVHARGIRRDLVWTLEKIAWHSRNFAQAADALLRLAIFENESYSNNASGTWIEFFGTMLPGTSAAPESRMAYLKGAATSEDSNVLALVVRAAARALAHHESIVVSAEVQGGVLVEPRGTPVTIDQALEYRNSAIDLLASLARDGDSALAEAATQHLVGSLHGLLETPVNRRHLAETVAVGTPDLLARMRNEIEGLRRMFERVKAEDDRPAALAEVESFLPTESSTERLRVLTSTKSWQRAVDELAAEILQVAKRADPYDPVRILVSFLNDQADLPAAYAVGRALGLSGLDYAAGVKSLGQFAGTQNGEALVGFLHELLDRGDSAAVDRFLDTAALPPLLTLQYTVRGPQSEAANARVSRLIDELSVVDAARVLFGWLRDADQSVPAAYLKKWAPRIRDQESYNAALDFAGLYVYEKPDALADLDPEIASLVRRRTEFPSVGQQEWEWSHLARRQLSGSPLAVVKLLADLVRIDAINAFSGSEEARLLQDAVALAGEDAWTLLMDQLEGGHWRLSFTTQEWLGNAASLDVAKRWVGSSVSRARTLANVTDPGGSNLSPIARFLLDEFGGDDKVRAYLVGQFVSGMWTGNESDRIKEQIIEVEGWVSEPGQSAPVISWARSLLASLKDRLRSVLQAEEEGEW